MAILSKINGYKTYLVCAASIAFTASQMWSGTVDMNTGVQSILAALAGASIRHSIQKTLS